MEHEIQLEQAVLLFNRLMAHTFPTRLGVGEEDGLLNSEIMEAFYRIRTGSTHTVPLIRARPLPLLCGWRGECSVDPMLEGLAAERVALAREREALARGVAGLQSGTQGAVREGRHRCRTFELVRGACQPDLRLQ